MKPELKKLLVLNLPYLLFVYLFAKCGQAYRLAAGVDASAKLLHLTNGISVAFASPLPSLHLFDLCVGVAGAVAVRLIVYSKGKNAKKYRKGEEYGSARWGTAKDIAPYIDPKFENNILLTQTERLTMTGRPKDPKTARNKNVLVIGGSGSGKTRFYVKPNLMQCFPTSDYPTSFVVTDPNGILIGKPFKIIHSDPQSRELAISKIKEAQEMYSLESRCFLESTGIYHIPLLCFLRDKGFDCAVINPIITKNSTNMNVRKLHNDKFDSKKAAKVGLDASLKASIVPDDAIIDLRNLVRDYYYFKDLQSAIVLKLHAELNLNLF